MSVCHDPVLIAGSIPSFSAVIVVDCAISVNFSNISSLVVSLPIPRMPSILLPNVLAISSKNSGVVAISGVFLFISSVSFVKMFWVAKKSVRGEVAAVSELRGSKDVADPDRLID